MQTQRIVARLLEACAQFMHPARLLALYDVSCSAVSGSWLTLSSLACGTARPTALRHRIKCVDRLIGNVHLHNERLAVYRALAHRWLSDLPQLLTVVDWSSLSADMHWHWLRASVVVDGRSLTLYEEVHARRYLGNGGVHRRFVDRLAQLLPPCERPPIVITDAGFRTPWFQLLAKHNWRWIGRIRNRDFVRQDEGPWFAAKTLYGQARPSAQDLGRYECIRSNPIRCRFVLIKKAATGRRHRDPSGKEQRHSQARKTARCSANPGY